MKEDTKNSREINYVYIISENEMQSWLLPLSLSTSHDPKCISFNSHLKAMK
jgi:hypothetical protein